MSLPQAASRSSPASVPRQPEVPRPRCAVRAVTVNQVGFEVPLEDVRSDRVAVVRLDVAAESTFPASDDALVAHQSLDALPADSPPLRSQLAVHPRTAVHAPGLLLGGSNLLDQTRPLPLPRTSESRCWGGSSFAVHISAGRISRAAHSRSERTAACPSERGAPRGSRNGQERSAAFEPHRRTSQALRRRFDRRLR